MRVNHIMTPTVTSIDPEASLFHAAGLMLENDLGWLPVVVGDRVLGVVSDRDIVLRTVSIGLDPVRCGIQQAMSTDVAWCHTDNSPEEAAFIMRNRKVRRLLVLDREQRFKGVISLGDLASRLSDGSLGGAVLAAICS
jgi:CBS domain-containing protein